MAAVVKFDDKFIQFYGKRQFQHTFGIKTENLVGRLTVRAVAFGP